MVTYGKTLGGGLPVGVLCGRRDLMKRFREDRPADVCFARGTFNSHPYVMGAMQEFLAGIERPEIAALYENLDAVWDGRAARLNQRLRAEGLPLQVANMSTIWTISYTQPSRYNWMLQYYLRAEGLALSWVGTGRLIFNLAYSEADFNAVADKLVAAVTKLGLEPTGKVGDHFDPAVHEAVQFGTSPEVTEPTVTTVFRSGYSFAGKLLRPAVVVVTGPEHDAGTAAAESGASA
jgi:glutamate-1-semialdehyde 2,1-aminomutase